MRIHAFGASSVNSQRHCLGKIEKKSALMMSVFGQGVPSPHGVRFIIRIHQGFLPLPLGDGLFKDASDRAAFVAIIGDPIQTLASGKRVAFFIVAIVA